MNNPYDIKSHKFISNTTTINAKLHNKYRHIKNSQSYFNEKIVKHVMNQFGLFNYSYRALKYSSLTFKWSLLHVWTLKLTWAFEKQKSIREWEGQRVWNGLLNRSLYSVEWIHEHQDWAFNAILLQNKFSFWLPTESGSWAAVKRQQVSIKR